MVKCVQTAAKWGSIASALSHCAKHAAPVKRFLLRQTFCVHSSCPRKAVSQAYARVFHSYHIWFASAEGNGNVQQWLGNLNRNPRGISSVQANFQIWERRSSHSSPGIYPQQSKGQNSQEYMSFLEFVQEGKCCSSLVRIKEWSTRTVIAERNILEC